MTAIAIGEKGYISKAPPWSHRMFKMGRLANEKGKIPPALKPYLLEKGDVSPIVRECREAGKAGTSMVQCINTHISLERSKTSHPTRKHTRTAE